VQADRELHIRRDSVVGAANVVELGGKFSAGACGGLVTDSNLQKEAFEQKLVMQLRNIKAPKARRAKLGQILDMLMEKRDHLHRHVV
jgi:hypothetical protein